MLDHENYFDLEEHHTFHNTADFTQRHKKDAHYYERIMPRGIRNQLRQLPKTPRALDDTPRFVTDWLAKHGLITPAARGHTWKQTPTCTTLINNLRKQAQWANTTT